MHIFNKTYLGQFCSPLILSLEIILITIKVWALLEVIEKHFFCVPLWSNSHKFEVWSQFVILVTYYSIYKIKLKLMNR